MSYRAGIITGILCTLVVAGIAWWLGTSGPAAATNAPAATIPAKVPNPLKEESVNTITLTAEAVERLAVETAVVERKPLRRVRVYGGEVIVPTGQSVVVAAPLNGILKVASEASPQPGAPVKRGQVLFRLLPLLGPESRANLAASGIDAEGQVKTARTQLEAAQLALERTDRLFKSEAGSRRALDEAQAEVDVRRRLLEAAIARHELLSKAVGEIESGTSSVLDIEAPVDGLLQTISAQPGQNVPAGATLFEVVDVRTLWVKVPVYVGDLRTIDATVDALVGDLAARPGNEGDRAQRAIAPPSADATTGTLDLFYHLENNQRAYHPGQRVSVTLPMNDEAESLTLPFSAVVYDIHGGAWVYERTGDRTFVRRRVVVRYVLKGDAALASGPEPGVRVVTAGAAELFGTETGFSK